MSHPASVRARRAGGLAVLTVGAFSLGGPATALAAPADEAPDPGTTSRPEAEPAAEVILTPVPLPGPLVPFPGGLVPIPGTLDSDPDVGATGAHFGWGKLEPDVVVATGSSLPAGAALDRTGAGIRVTYSQVWGEDASDVVQFPDGPPVLECTWDESDADGNGNLCDFTGNADVIGEAGEAQLFPMSTFTVELIAAPTSGQVLLPSPGAPIRGYTDWDGEGPVSAVFEAPVAERAAVPAAGGPVEDNAPASLPVAVPMVPEQPAPTTPLGTPAATPAADSPTAPTSTPAHASGTAGALADTGAEPLPVLALGTGLVLAGGAVIVVAARRRTR